MGISVDMPRHRLHNILGRIAVESRRLAIGGHSDQTMRQGA